MLKKLAMTTALSGLMMSAALAQAVDTKPIDTPAAKSPPAATAPASTPGGKSFLRHAPASTVAPALPNSSTRRSPINGWRRSSRALT